MSYILILLITAAIVLAPAETSNDAEINQGTSYNAVQGIDPPICRPPFMRIMKGSGRSGITWWDRRGRSPAYCF